MESLGYSYVGKFSGSGKYEMLLVERDGVKYIARVGDELSDYEEQYCRYVSDCPNVLASTFLKFDRPIALRRFVPRTLCDALSDRLPEVVLVRVLIDVCRALECIHSKNLVYADLKPENIGIEGCSGWLLDTDSLTRPFTKPRFVTPKYAPPEYHSWGVMVKESDIYQLGLVLSEVSNWCSTAVRQRLEEVAAKLTVENPFARPSASNALKMLKGVAKSVFGSSSFSEGS